eukprot:scaffold121408_cov30-Tisochrysis_lutea.AAC.2
MQIKPHRKTNLRTARLHTTMAAIGLPRQVSPGLQGRSPCSEENHRPPSQLEASVRGPPQAISGQSDDEERHSCG